MPLNLTRLTLVLYSILLFTPCGNYFVHVSQKEGQVYFPGEFIIAAKYGLFVEIAKHILPNLTMLFEDWTICLQGVHPIYRVYSATKNTFPSI